MIFTDNVNDSDFEKLRCVKRILVKEFEEYNVSKLVDELSISENLFNTLTVGELKDILNKTDTFGENNINLISFEHFVESNVESK